MLRNVADIEISGTMHRVVFDVNAIVELEELFGTSIQKVFLSWQEDVPIFRVTRALLWAGLKKHNPKITLAAAGSLLRSDDVQDLAKVFEALVKTISRAIGHDPDTTTAATEADPADPQTPTEVAG
jgi:hypothetical protein